jgi:hypothetical protein
MFSFESANALVSPDSSSESHAEIRRVFPAKMKSFQFRIELRQRFVSGFDCVEPHDALLRALARRRSRYDTNAARRMPVKPHAKGVASPVMAHVSLGVRATVTRYITRARRMPAKNRTYRREWHAPKTVDRIPGIRGCAHRACSRIVGTSQISLHHSSSRRNLTSST